MAKTCDGFLSRKIKTCSNMAICILWGLFNPSLDLHLTQQSKTLLGKPPCLGCGGLRMRQISNTLKAVVMNHLLYIIYQHMCSSLTLFSTLGIGNHQHPPCIVQFFYHFPVCRIQELSCYGWAVRPCHEPNGAGNGEAKLIHGFLVWEFDQHTHTRHIYIYI